jgi:orotate phosphoribosyltransferase
MKLASGKTSTFYFNMKPTMLDPEGAALIAELMLDAIAADNADLVGGLEMGAVPIASAVAAVSRAEAGGQRLLRAQAMRTVPRADRGA